MNIHVPSLQRSLSDVVAEYETKVAAIPQALKDFEAAGNALKMASTIGGTWGNTSINTGNVHESELRSSLLKSAWRHVYQGLNIETIASADDKRKFERAMEQPAPFTLDNIRGTFGPFIKDPRGNILRGLAEVFCSLDPFYKSHDRVKIGVRGLPKRIILSRVGDYGSYGRDKLRDVLNALAAYQGKPLITNRELEMLCKREDALEKGGMMPADRTWSQPFPFVGRGVRLRRFDNGNGHLMFNSDTLRDINKALAEFYGDVLPDCAEERPDKPEASTAVAKDLQYYPTPVKVVEDVLDEIYRLEGQKVLEPSCGCGRFLDGIRKRGGQALGIEVDPSRAAIARFKGHNVWTRNFLEAVPEPIYDRVIMNPPFYGKHYAKHVEHAMKFLKPGGTLTAILPATARYDHGLVDGKWRDLPFGSFAESGTNINTTVLTKVAPK